MTGAALAISASGRAFSVALRPAGAAPLLGGGDGGAASQLHATIQATCAAHGVAPGDLRELRIDVGPGSYTGLRVAVTFARTALAFGDIEVFKTTSLQLMARAAVLAGAATAGHRVRTILDARRDRLHHALIAGDGNDLLEAPRASTLDELVAAVQPGELLLAAVELHPALRDGLCNGLASREVTLREPAPFDARLLFDDGVRLAPAGPDDLEPLYLMGSYAE